MNNNDDGDVMKEDEINNDENKNPKIVLVDENEGTTSPLKKKKVLRKIGAKNEKNAEPQKQKPKLERDSDEEADDPIEVDNDNDDEGDKNEDDIFNDDSESKDHDSFINDNDADSAPLPSLQVLMARANDQHVDNSRTFFKSQYDLKDAFSIFVQYLVSCMVCHQFFQIFIHIKIKKNHPFFLFFEG